MIQDHFTSEYIDNSIWQFCNMTSPCCEVPKRVGDSLLHLPEHEIWNEGNVLLSRAFLHEISSTEATFTGWDALCTGAGLGFYAGNGSFWGYVMLAATNTTIELRVHAGGQSGESFMSQGQPKFLIVAEVPWVKSFPFNLKLKRQDNFYIAELNGEEITSATIPEIKGDARAMFKALPGKDRFLPCYAFLDSAGIEGIAPTTALQGCIFDQETHRPIAHAGVHLAGYDSHFCLCDENGHYLLNNIPRGEHHLIAAAEGYAFTRSITYCNCDQPNSCDICLAPETIANCPRREYNQPSFDRSRHGYLQLNGTWQFCFDPGNIGIIEHWYAPDAPQYDRHIRVPFSSASLLGFGEEHLACGDRLHEFNTMFNNYHLTGQRYWYRRSFTVPVTFPVDEPVILHIGASSNVTYAWLDGKYLGLREDEYSDLAFDLGLLEPGSIHILVIMALYPHDIESHNMGKQIFWFSSAPGIWQSVWLEPRAKSHLDLFHLTPNLQFVDNVCTQALVQVDVHAVHADSGLIKVTLTAPLSGQVFSANITLSDGCGQIFMPVTEPELWEYRHGNLYQALAELFINGHKVDSVQSYIGLRKVETKWLHGHSPAETDDLLDQYQYVYLNGKPFYVIGVLDQCYNAFGIYTYRCLNPEGEQGARGSIAYDINRTLNYGYNLSRVHIKENEPLWYHECDKQGLLVWTEHPGNFYATPENPNWQSAYYRELGGMLERLHNFASIVILSTINESWGVEGKHCSTPWENELRFQFLETNAQIAKKAWPHVLICDNSGFGKTNACEINDFHLYPDDHDAARQVWKNLLKECYPGSIYNYINKAQTTYAVGDAMQTGRPILISEFLHFNGINMQLRLFEKIAGYLRMNVASHEMEDSGPLTAERYHRDYGYVDHHMQPLDYAMVNSMDMIIPDQNRLVQVHPGQLLEIDLYTAHFSWRSFKSPILHTTITGIDRLGRYKDNLETSDRPICFKPFRVEKQDSLIFTVPDDLRGAYLFFYITDGEEILCRNYIQLFIKNACTEQQHGEITIAPNTFVQAQGDYIQVFNENGAVATAVCGTGKLSYHLDVPDNFSDSVLMLELGAREGKNAIKVTDECLFGSCIHVLLDSYEIGYLAPKDDPSDERALFSNASQSGQPYNYRKTGRIGYGERFELIIPQQLMTAGRHVLEFICDRGGMTVYGKYTGRYGFDPVIVALSQVRD